MSFLTAIRNIFTARPPTNEPTTLHDLNRVAQQGYVVLRIANGYLVVKTNRFDVDNPAVYCKDIEAVSVYIVSTEGVARLQGDDVKGAPSGVVVAGAFNPVPTTAFPTGLHAAASLATNNHTSSP